MFGNTNTCMIKWKSSRGAYIPSQEQKKKFQNSILYTSFILYTYVCVFKKTRILCILGYNMRINDIAQLSINYKMK